MSVCPGCGRCRACGQPAPVKSYPTYPGGYPVWVYPYYYSTGYTNVSNTGAVAS